MKDIIVDEFQYTAQELLVRNKSILDLLTKFQDSNGHVNRAIVKAATQCGCIRINAAKQDVPEDLDFDEMHNVVQNHVEGKLCENCRDMVEKEMGKSMFYLASLCNTLDLNLYDVLIKELESIKVLGKYNLR